MYSLSLTNYITYRPFTNYNTKQIVKEKLKAAGSSYNEYRRFFDEKIISESKEFIFIFIPFYGLVFYLLFFWKQTYFTGHLSFAAHFIAFVLLWDLVSFYLIDAPLYLLCKSNYSQGLDSFLSTLTCVVVSIYLAIAMPKFYKVNYVISLLAAIGAGYTFFDLIQYYRMLLFFKILYF